MHINKEDYLKKGFLQIENFFSDKQFNILREFVDNKINHNKHKSFFLTSKTNSELDNFFQNNKVIRDKIETVIKKFNFVNENNDSFHSYKALRVIKNNRIKKQVRDFHFDSHILTILIPIYIPNRKKSENGHLMMSPKLRQQTKNIFLNMTSHRFLQFIVGKDQEKEGEGASRGLGDVSEIVEQRCTLKDFLVFRLLFS